MDKFGLLAAYAAAIHGGAACVVIDLDGEDPGFDGTLLRLLPVGSIRRVGDLRAAILMLLPAEVHLLNPSPTFDASWYRQQAARIGASSRLFVGEGEGPGAPGLVRILLRK